MALKVSGEAVFELGVAAGTGGHSVSVASALSCSAAISSDNTSDTIVRQLSKPKRSSSLSRTVGTFRTVTRSASAALVEFSVFAKWVFAHICRRDILTSCRFVGRWFLGLGGYQLFTDFEIPKPQKPLCSSVREFLRLSRKRVNT